MGESKSKRPKIKVVDRRKFNADGDPLDTDVSTPEPERPASPPEDPVVASEAPPAEAPAAGQRGRSSHQFLELVTMLAAQAELFLVGAEDLPAQPAEAKRLIDYLGVLEEKTAGNLSAEEAKLLSNVVYQLRTIFLQRT